MRKETIEIFKFDELSEEAKEVARKNYRKFLNEDFYYESDTITQNMEEYIDSKSNRLIDDLKIRWSLSCCQGDGVSFTGTIASRKNIIAFLKLILNRDLTKNEMLVAKLIDSINFERNAYCHYCHERSVTTEIYIDGDCGYIDMPHIDRIIEVFIQKIEAWRIALCRELEKGGYESIDFYNSNEYIDESIISNDYEFLADGQSL